MKTTEQFLKAKKDKNLNSLLLIQRNGETFIRLCIDEKSKYSDKRETVFVETPTEVLIENYSGYDAGETRKKREVNTICFHVSTYSYSYDIVKTFLASIGKDSDVKFKVVAFNGCETHKEANFVHHSLLGVIDVKKCFFLSDYVGKDNTASPIQASYSFPCLCPLRR